MSNSVFVYTGDIENPLLVHWGSDTGLFDADTGEMVGYGFDDLTIDSSSGPHHIVISNILDEEDADGLTWGEVEEIIKNRLNSSYDVIGVFTDTDDLQPFTYEHQATSAREAVAKAVDKANGFGGTWNGPVTDPDEDLDHATAMADIRVVSVRIQTDEQELLHTVDELVN